jgi:hypothetical protein
MFGKAKKAHGTWSYPGQGNEGHWFGWGFLPLELLGMLGPLIGAAVSLIITIICLWALKFTNVIFQSEFLSIMIGAADRNISWFFIVPLIVGYCQYFARRFYAGFALLMPIGNATSFTFSMWIIAWVFRTIGALANELFLSQIGAFLRANLAPIFAIVLVLGYLSVALRHFARSR